MTAASSMTAEGSSVSSPTRIWGEQRGDWESAQSRRIEFRREPKSRRGELTGDESSGSEGTDRNDDDNDNDNDDDARREITSSRRTDKRDNATATDGEGGWKEDESDESDEEDAESSETGAGATK